MAKVSPVSDPVQAVLAEARQDGDTDDRLIWRLANLVAREREDCEVLARVIAGDDVAVDSRRVPECIPVDRKRLRILVLTTLRQLDDPSLQVPPATPREKLLIHYLEKLHHLVEDLHRL